VKSRLSLKSGNDIGQQLIVDPDDLVFEMQFALFEPLQLQLVGDHLLGQSRNGCVQVAMLFLQHRQTRLKLIFLLGT
jgi:hypothetical protein